MRRFLFDSIMMIRKKMVVVVVVVVVELVREIKDTASVPRVQEPGAQVAIPWPVV